MTFDRFCKTYSERVAKELDDKLSKAAELITLPLQSIYLGGGTPSLFPIPLIESLIATVRRRFKKGQPEITIECNPESLSKEKAAAYRQLGVTRISLGIQTFDDCLLRLLGRAHSAATAHESLRIAQDAGFSCISADLMFGGPGQTPADFNRDLTTLLHYKIPHVSLYNLTLPRETQYLKRADLAHEDDQITMFHIAERNCRNAGLYRYEISNFARPGFESVHNSAYWRSDHYLGLGVAAHSSIEYDNARLRLANPSTLESYMAPHPNKEVTAEVIMGPTYHFENIMLALRTITGVPLHRWNRYCEAYLDRQSRNRIRHAQTCENPLLIEQNGAIKLTRTGLLLSDSLFSDLVPSLQAHGQTL